MAILVFCPNNKTTTILEWVFKRKKVTFLKLKEPHDNLNDSQKCSKEVFLNTQLVIFWVFFY